MLPSLRRCCAESRVRTATFSNWRPSRLPADGTTIGVCGMRRMRGPRGVYYDTPAGPFPSVFLTSG
jgi:hypothetical protein